MAHPFKKHSEQKKGRARASQLLKSAGAPPPDLVGGDGGPMGGMMAAGPPDRPPMPVPGARRGGRYARGGKVKGAGTTNIAIVVPQAKDKAGSPGAGAAPVPPLAPAPPPPMPGGPPPIGPGGPPIAPKPPGMMKRGGRVKHRRADGGGIEGDADKGNLAKWASRASSNSYARGGRLPTAGADSGVGRKQKAG